MLPLIYDLSDSGHLRFIDNQFNQLIGLGSPLIYLQLANKNSKSVFTMDEIFALKNPSGLYSNIAENVVLRILAQNSNIFNISGFIMTDKNVEKIILKENYTNIKTYADEIYACHNLDTITNKLFKECFMSSTNQMVKDALGINGLLLQSDANSLIAHRIQIKLGQHVIQDKDGTAIIENWNKQKKIFEDCFIAANKQISSCINYLVTTRSIEPNARKKLEEESWIILDQINLSKIWPDVIKQLGKPYSA